MHVDVLKNNRYIYSRFVISPDKYLAQLSRDL